MDADIFFSCSATNTDGSKWREVLTARAHARPGDAGFEDYATATVGPAGTPVPPIVTVTECGAIKCFNALKASTGLVGAQYALRGSADRSVILWDALRFEALRDGAGALNIPWSKYGGYMSVVLHDTLSRANVLVCNVHMPYKAGARQARTDLARHLEAALESVDAAVVLGDFNASDATLRRNDDLGRVLADFTNAYDGDGDIDNVYVSDRLRLPALSRAQAGFTHPRVSAEVEGDAGRAFLRRVDGDVF